jgi:hypothetical protein
MQKKRNTVDIIDYILLQIFRSSSAFAEKEVKGKLNIEITAVNSISELQE